MKFFSSETIIELTTIQEWIDAIILSMETIHSGDFVMPQRMHLDQNADTFLLMPCITNEYWATKLVSFCPENYKSKLPSIYGTIVLADAKTGRPLAIIDGGIVTAMRTAAVSAVGIIHLAPENCHTLGIVGTGLQGIHQAIFACSVREISDIWAYDEYEPNLDRFKKELYKEFPGVNVIRARDSSEVAINSELIITATNSQFPIFENKKELFTGKTFVGIGSYKKDCREYPEQLFTQVDQIFIDTLHGKKETGDLLTPVHENWIPEENIHPISDLMAGDVTLSDNPTRLYKTVGGAVFDLFSAKLIYENYLKSQNKE